MKILIISDVHGSRQALEALHCIADAKNPQEIWLLGDFLYHGPRNRLPDGHDVPSAVTLLNAWKERIIAVRGNCDAEVDQKVLQFPMLQSCRWHAVHGQRFFIAHGHQYGCNYGKNSLPPLRAGDTYICGHTHIPVAQSFALPSGGTVHVCNPGSCALPKHGWRASYGWLEDGLFQVRALYDCPATATTPQGVADDVLLENRID